MRFIRYLALGCLCWFAACELDLMGPNPFLCDAACGEWSEIAPPLTAVGIDAAAVTLNFQMFVVGGFPEGQPHICSGLTGNGTLQFYDPLTSQWVSRPAMPTPRAEHAAAAHGLALFAIGGCDGSSTMRRLDRYVLTTRIWTPLAPLPVDLVAPGAAVLNGKIYVVGGVNQSGYSAATYVYDVAANTWSTAAAAPAGHAWPGVIAFDGKLYVFGGQTGGNTFDPGPVTPHGDVFRYDPATNEWTALASPFILLQAPRPMIVAGNIYVLGTGTTKQHAGYDIILSFFPAVNGWGGPLLPRPERITGGVATGISEQFYVAGGQSSSGSASKRAWRFKP